MTTNQSLGAALAALRPLQARLCPVCGAGFQSREGAATYCSKRCKRRALYLRKKELASSARKV